MMFQELLKSIIEKVKINEELGEDRLNSLPNLTEEETKQFTSLVDAMNSLEVDDLELSGEFSGTDTEEALIEVQNVVAKMLAKGVPLPNLTEEDMKQLTAFSNAFSALEGEEEYLSGELADWDIETGAWAMFDIVLKMLGREKGYE